MKLTGAWSTTRTRVPRIALLALFAIGLAGCDGDDGKDGSAAPTGPSGPAGPTGPVGPTGPAGSSNTIPITSSQFASIIPAISKVTVPANGQPVVEFTLVDELNRPLTGLAAANIRFVVTRLAPGVGGKSSAWQAYTRTTAQPGTGPWPGTEPKNQSTAEVATAGTLAELGNGQYSYTFKTNITNIADIPYDAKLPHRVGLEIRNYPQATSLRMSNAPFTFLPSTGEATESGREIVDNDTCNACHDVLSFHGGPRTDVQYCTTCHDPYTFDPQSTNSVDMKVMIHKIHAGAGLANGYVIFGHGGTKYDYSGIVFTQDLRNCQTCHQESDATTPQASNWRTTVNSESCGTCHDDVNFVTGENHATGIPASDDQCAICHGPNSVFNLRPEDVHVDPVLEAGAKFKYEVLQVVDTAPGQKPTVTIRVTDPTNNDAPYDIKAAGGPFQIGNASLRVDVAWSTRPDFTNTGSGSATATTGAPAQPISIDVKATGVPDPAFPGSFKATATQPIPADATGSGSALLEGRPNVNLPNSAGVLVPTAVPVVSSAKPFTITDATAAAYREVVDIAKCNDCHKQLSLHGENRSGNAELCATCHNPNATDINRRVAGSNCETVTGTLDDQTIDQKVMVHAIHAGGLANYKVCGYNNTGYDYSEVTYPGRLNNCEGCHKADTYYPPDATRALPTTIDAGADRSSPTDDRAVSPATVVCSTCHGDDAAKAHMVTNGGSFNLTKKADGTAASGPVETCSVCHGPGRSSDVKVVHKVGGFRFN